ncbi:transposase [Streptomyces sp. NPDC020983]|uniref:transposase n=1 Tax=Streptomyces sp. NPDC020983 TaxID=3365106 RepID=UPI0037B12178
MTQRAKIAAGARVAFQEQEWTVVMLQGLQVQLVGDDGAVASVLLPHLLADEHFHLHGQAVPGVVGPLALLETLPQPVRDAALEWERHVREVESGEPLEVGGAVRLEYDPARRSMAEREAAKADELREAGQAASVATVRRMRARYRQQGVWGLVDQRATRGRSQVGRADSRVVEAVLAVLETNRTRSSGTLSRLRTQVGWALEEKFGPGVVSLPPQSTFNRLARALAEPGKLLDYALRQRNRASRPQPPFTPTVALRPGELVMLDSTPLDVLVVLDDGVTGRCELTIALDVATRTIAAAVLRPAGTRTVDAALLLALMATPLSMRPGWDEALAMRRSVIPFERLVTLDARLEHAAARPVIMPEMIVVDQGRVFVSTSFVAACGSLGISFQPVPPANGPAKGGVERTFESINTQFCQYVAGYTGSNVTQRGSSVADEACWTLPQLQDLLDEWIVAGWQHRPHDGLRHPMMPKRALSPNQMWAALIGLTGYVPVPLTGEDYLELLPVKWQPITDAGIRFDYRTYDNKALGPYRGQRSRHTAQNGTWEVHYNPYEPHRVWVRLPEVGFVEVPWIHASEVTQPFTDFAWQHIRKTIPRTTDREEHELILARALNALLKRASAGHGTPRERTIAARAAASATLPHLPAPPSGLDVLATPTLIGAPPAQADDPEDDENWPADELEAPLDFDSPDETDAAKKEAEDGEEDVAGGDGRGGTADTAGGPGPGPTSAPVPAARRRGSSIINDDRKGPDQWL